MGQCPACRKNVHDLAGADPHRTKVTIDSGQPLPPCCIVCGVATPRTQGHLVSRPRADAPKPRELLSDAWTVVLGLLQLIFWKLTRAAFEDIVFHLPVCRGCEERKDEILIGPVDWETYRATVLVHVAFARQLEASAGGHHRP